VGGELVVAFGRIAGHELDQLAVVIGGGRHHLAGAALPQLARGDVGLQEGVELGIGHAQALRQRGGGLVGARDVAAGQDEMLGGEGVELGVEVLGREVLDDQALGQCGCIGRHRGDAERGAGEDGEDGDRAGSKAAGVGMRPVRNATEQGLDGSLDCLFGLAQGIQRQLPAGERGPGHCLVLAPV
jgi:hypothetical protein